MKRRILFVLVLFLVFTFVLLVTAVVALRRPDIFLDRIAATLLNRLGVEQSRIEIRTIAPGRIVLGPIEGCSTPICFAAEGVKLNFSFADLLGLRVGTIEAERFEMWFREEGPARAAGRFEVPERIHLPEIVGRLPFRELRFTGAQPAGDRRSISLAGRIVQSSRGTARAALSLFLPGREHPYTVRVQMARNRLEGSARLGDAPFLGLTLESGRENQVEITVSGSSELLSLIPAAVLPIEGRPPTEGRAAFDLNAVFRRFPDGSIPAFPERVALAVLLTDFASGGAVLVDGASRLSCEKEGGERWYSCELSASIERATAGAFRITNGQGRWGFALTTGGEAFSLTPVAGILDATLMVHGNTFVLHEAQHQFLLPIDRHGSKEYELHLVNAEASGIVGGEEIPPLDIAALVEIDQAGGVRGSAVGSGAALAAPIELRFDTAESSGQAWISTEVTPSSASPLILSELPFLGSVPVEFVGGTVRAETARQWGERFKGQYTVSLQNVSGLLWETPFSGGRTTVTLTQSNAQLELPQTPVSIESIHPGIELSGVQAQISFRAGGKAGALVTIEKGRASLLGGEITIPHAAWHSTQAEHEMTLLVHRVSLERILALYEQEQLFGEGLLEGEIPLTIGAEGVFVRRGVLRSVQPGRLRAGGSVLASLEGIEGLEVAARALSDYRYDDLVADLSYDPGGRMEIGLSMRGYSPALNTRRPVNVNLRVEENLLSLLRSLRIISEIEREVFDGSTSGRKG